MKKLLLASVCAIVFAASCDNASNSHMAEIAQMRDSIFERYPTVAAVTINLEDNKLLIVTLGDASMASASDEDRRKVAVAIGQLSKTVFGPESHIEQGKLIVTKDEHNSLPEPADGIVTEMPVK